MDDTSQRSGSCPACQRRDPEFGAVCEPCRRWLPVAVRSIGDWYIRLLDDLVPTVEGDGRVGPRLVYDKDTKRMVPVFDDAGRPVPALRDGVAAATPSGPAPGRGMADLVTSSTEPSTPLDVDKADLLAPVVRDGGRPIDTPGDNWVIRFDTQPRDVWHDGVNGRQKVTLLTRRRIGVPAGDQIGHTPVAAVLDRHVRAFIAAGAPGSRWRPVPTVTTMVEWLNRRLDWACDNYPDVGGLVADLRTLRGRMMSALGEFDPPPQHCDGVECNRCDQRQLFRRQDGSGDIECGNPDCAKVYSAEEYAAWVKHLGGYEASIRNPAEVQDLLRGRASADH